MVYFIIKDADDPGFEERYLEVIGVSINGKLLGTADFISTPENFNAANAMGYQIKLMWLPSMKNPILTVPSEVDNPGDYTRVDDVYNLLLKYYKAGAGTIAKEVMDQLKQYVAAHYPNDYKEKMTASYVQILWENQESVGTTINVSATDVMSGDFFIVTNNKIQQHNSSMASSFKSLKPSENVTLFQTACTDPLFLEIPSRNALLSFEGTTLNQFIPKASEVCMPYSDANAYSYQYKEKGVPKHLIPMIEGNPENNKLDIQENEKKYYDALVEWIEYNIKQEFNLQDSDLTDGNAVIDDISQEYLAELADHIYAWHWSHNKAMPVSFSPEDEDEKNENSRNDSVSSRYEFIYDENTANGCIENAVVSLNAFLEDVSAKLGYKIYAEAIIKLARWGSRKPTALVFEGYPVIFDLATNSCKHNLGSISDYQVKLKDGRQYELVSTIVLDNDVADAGLGVKKITIPVGFTAVSTYVKDDAALKVPTYFSLFEAIPALKDRSLEVDGIQWDGEQFEIKNVNSIGITTLVSDYEDNSDQFLKNPFSRENDLKDLCIEFSASGGDSFLNLMNIINAALKNTDLTQNFEKYQMGSVGELRDMIVNGIAYSTNAVLVTNIAKITLPVLTAVENRAAGKTLTECFNVFNEELAGWKGIRSFFSVKKDAKEAEENVPSDSATGKMSAFGAEEQKQTIHPADRHAYANSDGNAMGKTVQGNHTDTEQAMQRQPSERADSVLLQAVPAGTYKSITNVTSDEIIGGYVTEPVHDKEGKAFNRFLIFDKETWDSLDSSSKANASVSVLQILPYFCDDLMKIARGDTDKIKLVFNSPKSIHHFTKYMQAGLKPTVEEILKNRDTVNH